MLRRLCVRREVTSVCLLYVPVTSTVAFVRGGAYVLQDTRYNNAILADRCVADANIA